MVMSMVCHQSSPGWSGHCHPFWLWCWMWSMGRECKLWYFHCPTGWQSFSMVGQLFARTPVPFPSIVRPYSPALSCFSSSSHRFLLARSSFFFFVVFMGAVLSNVAGAPTASACKLLVVSLFCWRGVAPPECPGLYLPALEGVLAVMSAASSWRVWLRGLLSVFLPPKGSHCIMSCSLTLSEYALVASLLIDVSVIQCGHGEPAG